ncbi:MAG TPA: DnaJ domain-containing protein [Rhodocyclaceae bacterium]|nr:DnaJ domain-containing protein [Rhodocyclaceae bacterium]
MGKSLYDILDIDETATPLNINNAYRRLKAQYEQNLPEDDDRHISAIQYQAIGEAYAVLSNPTRREIYDKKLITDRQNSYISVTEPSGFPVFKVFLLTLLAVVTWLGYTHYQRTQAKYQLELKRIELEKEQARVSQETLRLAAEEAARQEEEIRAARQEAWEHERSLAQSRYDAEKLANDLASAEEAERRRREAERREQARLDAEWQRRERSNAQGPKFIRTY